jgi:hypothetical protein
MADNAKNAGFGRANRLKTSRVGRSKSHTIRGVKGAAEKSAVPAKAFVVEANENDRSVVYDKERGGWEVTRDEAIAAARARVIADQIRGARTDARIVQLSKLEARRGKTPL